MYARTVPVIEGRDVRLRPLRESDRDERMALGRDPEFVRLNGGDPARVPPFTEADAQAWYESFRDSLRWAIEHDGRLIGETRLHAIDPVAGVARFAIGIFDPECWGRGYGTEATRLVLSHAFDVLGLRRVELRVLAFNERAIRAYEKCGFRREGVQRDAALISGEWHDDLLMSIHAGQYRAASEGWAPRSR